MKKTLLLIVYVILAAAIIGWASWYANQLSGAPAASMAESQTATQTTSTTNNSMDGLQITDVTVGTGTVAQAGDTVTVNYAGTLDNGTQFDSSYSRNQPFTFLLGAGHVIQGWDQGIVGMKVGGTRKLVIPASLGYGAAGRPPVIPPNATLHFTVELLSVSTSTPLGQ